MEEKKMKSNGADSRSSAMKRRRLLSVAAVLLICCLAFVGAVGADVSVVYDNTKSEEENGFVFWNAVSNAADGDTIIVSEGVYTLNDGQTSRITTSKTLTIVGTNRENTVIKGLKYGLVIQNIDSNSNSVITLKNLTLKSVHSWGHSLYVKDYANVVVEDVIMSNVGVTAILLDSSNTEVSDVDTVVSVKNVIIEEGDNVQFNANPCNAYPTASVTYTHFTILEGCNFDVTDCHPQTVSKGVDNHFVNDVIINPSVAKIGDVGYATLVEAVEDAEDDDIIFVMQDVTISATLDIRTNITINGRKSDGSGNYKITGPDGSELFKISGSGITVDIMNIHLETKSSNIVGDIGDENKIDIYSGVTSNVKIPEKYLIEGCESVGSETSWTVQLKKFIVQFDSKEGTAVDSQTIEYGNPVVKPVDPTKEGFTFSKWVNGDEEWNFEDVVTSPLILNATWIENPVVPPTSSSVSGISGYLSFPRTTNNGGLVDFGASKVIKEVILPEGSSGSVVLTVESIYPYPEELETEYTFDISVEKLGSGMAYILFEIPEAKLTVLELSAADIGAYHLVDGEWVKLTTTYEVKDDIVCYEAETDSFSPFKLVIEEGATTPKAEENIPVIPPTEEPEDKPEDIAPPIEEPTTPSDEPETPAPLLAVLAGLGAAVLSRRK